MPSRNVTMAAGRLNVSNARFSGPSTDMSITGAVSLKPKTLLDLRVNGDVNLKLAQSFVEDIETAGTLAVNACGSGISSTAPNSNGWPSTE